LIAKQIKGKSFRGCVSYVLSKEGAEMIHTNMLGESVDELSREFGQSRKLKPNLQKCVYHASLSLPKDENLSNIQWSEVGQKYVKEMGFDGSQYMAVLHKDTEHQHIHIIASRIRLDGTVVSDSNDYKRSEKIIRGLEVEYGLERVRSSREVELAAPSRGELRKVLNEHTPSTKMRLQEIISNVTDEKQSMTTFIKKLELEGVGVIANVSEKTGHISGISFILNGELMKGSDLGKGFTWGKLKNKGIEYDINKESEFVIEHAGRIRETSLQQPYHKNERGNAIKLKSFTKRSWKNSYQYERNAGQGSEGDKSASFKYETRNIKFISELFGDDGEDRVFSNSDDEGRSKLTSSRGEKKPKKLSTNNKCDRSSRPDSFTEDLFRNSQELLPDKESNLFIGEESDKMGNIRGKSSTDLQKTRSENDQADDSSRRKKLKDKNRRKAKSKKRGFGLGL